MHQKVRLALIWSGGLFLLLADRIFKWLALDAWSAANMPLSWLGWKPFLNAGIGFGIPLPNAVIIIFSAIILAAVIYLWAARAGELTRNGFWECGGDLMLVFFGAGSNLYDRVVYGAAVDYWQILTSVINLADVMIVAGFAWYWLRTRKNAAEG